MAPKRTHKLLVTSDPGLGKTTLMLAYSLLPTAGGYLYIDYEHSADWYVVDDPAQADPAEGLFYVRRLNAPDLYSLRFLINVIRFPLLKKSERKIGDESVNYERVSQDVKELASQIVKGQFQVGTIAIDTITRLCDQTTEYVFQNRHNLLDGRDSITQFIWGKVKDDIADLQYQLIESGLNVLLSAWAKPEYIRKGKKGEATGEIVADVLRNVPYFADLVLTLKPAQRERGALAGPPMAIVTKSRFRRLPAGAVIKAATWENILAAQPQFLEIADLQPVEVAPVEAVA